jgi:hypothetical protein
MATCPTSPRDDKGYLINSETTCSARFHAALHVRPEARNDDRESPP